MNFGTISDIGDLNEAGWEQIDWERSLTTDTKSLAAANKAATQFHYANTSHLILCGKIIKQELGQTSADLTRLAVYLSSRKLDHADVWGRYIERADASASISKPMTSYYRQLFSETDARALLIGMETLGGPAAHTLYDNMANAADPLFQQITEQLAEQKQEETQYVADMLTADIQSLDTETREALNTKALNYSKATESLMTFHRAPVDAFGLDPNHVKQQIHDNIHQFYTDIGLTP